MHWPVERIRAAAALDQSAVAQQLTSSAPSRARLGGGRPSIDTGCAGPSTSARARLRGEASAALKPSRNGLDDLQAVSDPVGGREHGLRRVGGRRPRSATTISGRSALDEACGGERDGRGAAAGQRLTGTGVRGRRPPAARISVAFHTGAQIGWKTPYNGQIERFVNPILQPTVARRVPIAIAMLACNASARARSSSAS